MKRGNAENVLMAGKLCEVEKIEMCYETLSYSLVFFKSSIYKRADRLMGGGL